MPLPSESLGIVAYAADDLRIEPVPDRELAGDSNLRAPMMLGPEMVGTVVHAAGDGQQTGRRRAGRGPPGRSRRHPVPRRPAELSTRQHRVIPAHRRSLRQLRHPAQQDVEAAARRTQTPRC